MIAPEQIQKYTDILNAFNATHFRLLRRFGSLNTEN